MRTSVSLPEELASYVEEHAASAGENNAEAIRETIRRAKRLDEKNTELFEQVEGHKRTLRKLRNEIDDLETDVERLQNEKQQILEQREEHSELVRAVERERTLQERKAQAGLATRAKWAIFGMDDEE